MCFTFAIIGFTFSSFCVLWFFCFAFLILLVLLSFLPELELELEIKINMAMIFTQCWPVREWEWGWRGARGFLGAFVGGGGLLLPLCICLWEEPSCAQSCMH